MPRRNIAIIGLGRTGSAFLGAVLRNGPNINLVCVAEHADTPAKKQALATGIRIASMDEIIAMGDKIDLIFDLTGDAAVRKELHEKLAASDNDHTAVVPADQVALRTEHFHNNEDMEFRIPSKKGMRSILQGMVEQNERVSLYYGTEQTLFLTSMLGIDEHGIWLDISHFPHANSQLLLSDRIVFVSMYQQVKIQFKVCDIRIDPLEHDEAFYVGLPDYLLRIQRREFFRTAIPPYSPLHCLIPLHAGESGIDRTIPVMDISGGGIALLGEEHENMLLPERTFPNCRIAIPDIGTLTLDIEVRSSTCITGPDKSPYRRIGCRFINLASRTERLLQVYIGRLQNELTFMARV